MRLRREELAQRHEKKTAPPEVRAYLLDLFTLRAGDVKMVPYRTCEQRKQDRLIAEQKQRNRRVQWKKL